MKKTLIERIEVGSGGAASVEFTSIPQDATHLVLLFSSRSGGVNNNTGDYELFGLQFNSSTSNYSAKHLDGLGASVQTQSRTTTTIGGATYARFSNGLKNSYNGNTAFESGQFTIANYAGSNPKSYSLDSVGEANQTDVVQTISAGLWNDTSAITSIKLATVSNFVEFSSFTLYKVTAGNDGTTTVS